MYFNLRRYRSIINHKEKSLKFRKINHLMTSKFVGKAMIGFGGFLIMVNLCGIWTYFENP